MEDELVIFTDLPDKSTPFTAYNLNHNFDVYNKQIKAEASKIDSTLQNIQNFQTQTEESINTKTQEFTTNIEDKIQELSDDITTKTNTLQEDITNEINAARQDLMTEIGKQIASITSLSVEIVDTLPTESISETTIYLIKPENIPSGVQNASAMSRSFQANQSQLYSLNNEVMTRESVMALDITDSDYYIACFWVKIDESNHKWVAVGTTKIDLSQYSTTEQMNKAINDKATEIISQLTALIPTKVSSLQNDAGYLTSETDPSVPSYVKSISQANINSWNGKAEVSAIPTKTSDLTNDSNFVKVIEATNEQDAITKSKADPNNIYYWVSTGAVDKPGVDVEI